MREFQERRRLRKLLHSRYAIAALVILCGLLVHAVWGVYLKYEKSKRIAERTQIELAELESRQRFLEGSLADLNTDAGKEREAREKFGVVKEGERLIILVNDQAESEALSVPHSDGWWSRFLGFFGL